jgi:hypothetical protein
VCCGTEFIEPNVDGKKLVICYKGHNSKLMVLVCPLIFHSLSLSLSLRVFCLEASFGENFFKKASDHR